ncbi:MAG: creatininase family protein [Alphaproteobacteria bacterium]|nr:creatininase family protein [Alphaproteobacteria bacterium]
MTALPSRYWQDLSTVDFAALDAARVIAVQPVAAIEQHGPHLPVSVDACINEGVLGAALEHLAPELPVLVLPLQTIGKSDEHNRFPGTLSISAETLIRHWNDIGDSVARAGVRKLVLFNSHGGNPAVMDIVARDLRIQHGMLAVAANWYDLVDLEMLFDPMEVRHGIHGGEIETSMMLHLRPNLVDMTKAETFASFGAEMAQSYSFLLPTAQPSFAWETQDLNRAGAVGNAAAADAVRGKKAVDAAANGFAALLEEVDRFDLESLVTEAPDR